MFSWSKKSDSKKRPKRRGGSGGPTLNEFGIPVNEQSEKDEELEAELRALTGGVISFEEDLEVNEEGSDVEAEFERMFGQSKSKKMRKKKTGKGSATNVEEGADVSVDMNVPDANEDDVEDEDLNIDENDPELLGELMGLTEADEEEEGEGEEEKEDEAEEKKQQKEGVTITSLLKERLNMYKTAEAKAKENKESSRARRFARGIKTLQQLIKKAEAGQPVLNSEIPPAIATNLKPAPPPAPASPEENEQTGAPPQAITQPENDIPIEEVNNLTVDDKIQEADEEGNERNTTPPPPPLPEREAPGRTAEPSPPALHNNPWLSMLNSRRDEYKASALTAKRNNDLETALKHVKWVKQLNALIAAAEMGEEIDESEIPPSLSRSPARKPVEIMKPLKFEAPDECEDYEIPKTASEALNQRLGIYQSFQREAELKGDEAGMKRNAKIVEVYREAIKLHKAGRKVPLAKLPTPPGCPPIPIPFEVD